MRLLIVATLLALTACTEGASSSRIDYRTFRIQGESPGGTDAPNRHLAVRLCPNGYRVLDHVERRNTPDGYAQEDGVFTNWTIRCI